MIVIGSDPPKSSHTFAAVDAATGELCGTLTVPARVTGAERALRWARGLDGERCWAIEDCRHVPGRLERALAARGERTGRVAPRSPARKRTRERGKSDPIDAAAVARAALQEGADALPGAHLDERALEIAPLLDHHDDLVADRSDEQQRLRWPLHELFQALEIAAGALDREI